MWGLSLCHNQIAASLQDSKKTALHLLCENDACSTAALEAMLSARADVNAVDEVRIRSCFCGIKAGQRE